jgi:hypothetical protein
MARCDDAPGVGPGAIDLDLELSELSPSPPAGALSVRQIFGAPRRSFRTAQTPTWADSLRPLQGRQHRERWRRCRTGGRLRADARAEAREGAGRVCRCEGSLRRITSLVTAVRGSPPCPAAPDGAGHAASPRAGSVLPRAVARVDGAVICCHPRPTMAEALISVRPLRSPSVLQPRFGPPYLPRVPRHPPPSCTRSPPTSGRSGSPSTAP